MGTVSDPRGDRPTSVGPDGGGPAGPRPRGRSIPIETGVVPGGLDAGGGATSSFAAPADAPTSAWRAPAPIRIGEREFGWGERTYVMGVVNVTPDSFSGDGLLAAGSSWVDAAVAQAVRMADEGADLIDVGGESSRPGHDPVNADEEIRRVVPVVAAIRAALPTMPVSVDTTKPEVAVATIEAGASLVNDVWGVAEDDALSRVVAERGVPIVLMHNRAEARYVSVVAEIVADLQRAVDRAVRAGVQWESILVDPGFGFGKAPVHNLALLRDLSALRVLGRPVLLGTSRKSTLGKVLDLPPEERLEATLATTALAAAAGLDLVRVHDVRPNVRVARMTDAVVRSAGALPVGSAPGAAPSPLALAPAATASHSASPGTGRSAALERPGASGGPGAAGSALGADRIVLRAMSFDGRHGALEGEKAEPQPFEVDVEMTCDLRTAGETDDLAATVDYGAVYAVARRVVEATSRDLLEAIAEEIAREVLAGWPAVDAVVVRVRKMRPPIAGRLAWAGVEVSRARGSRVAD